MGRRPVTNKALLTHIGASLKAARTNKALTQEEAANRIGVHHRMMSKYERGLNVPGLDVLLDLAKLYGLDLPSIFSVADEALGSKGGAAYPVGSRAGQLSAEEEELVILYRESLPSHRRATIAGLLADLPQRGREAARAREAKSHQAE